MDEDARMDAVWARNDEQLALVNGIAIHLGVELQAFRVDDEQTGDLLSAEWVFPEGATPEPEFMARHLGGLLIELLGGSWQVELSKIDGKWYADADRVYAA